MMSFPEAMSHLDDLGVREHVAELVRSRRVTMCEVFSMWRDERVADVGVEVWEMLIDECGFEHSDIEHIWGVGEAEIEHALDEGWSLA
jgi:hypothetical protein